MAAVASATVAVWPVSAATHQAATQQSAAPAGPDVAAAGTASVRRRSYGQTGQLLILKPEFMAHQAWWLALEARHAAAARRARRAAARRRATERAAARQAVVAAAAVQRREAHRRAVQAASPGQGQPSGSPQQVAMAMLGSYGWSSGQFGCLNDLWSRESGWDATAENPSGAYGIPQALPGSKMASAGADWATDPATQIRWGLGYIREIYGSPCGAWSHELATGSY